MKVVDVVQAVGKFEGNSTEYVLRLIRECQKAGIPRPVIHLKAYFYYRFRHTGKEHYKRALHFLSCIEMYVKIYNDKKTPARERSLYRKILRGYNLLL